ncbi:uncharacterized protein LOC135389577 [Ornithodoros turicata]|uniref:uncharacterized protein LOC135389577 n=1 Tax=Ornithodoros turicata TaxID=34597 RepID=UPI003139503F
MPPNQAVSTVAPELKFCVEQPSHGMLRFLDLTFHCNPGFCWSYGKENCKPVLPYSSAHSKLVKFGVCTSLLNAATKKSCFHFVWSSLRKQCERLTQAGYDNQLIAKRAMKLLESSQCRPWNDGNSRNVVVIPYFHAVAHNILAVAKYYNIKVVFSNAFKLSRLTPFSSKSEFCGVRHRKPFVPCKQNVVYSIPLECGFVYVGQTRRCLNDRIREHAANVERMAGSSELVDHLRDCRGCQPCFKDTTVLAWEPYAHRRLFRESLEIATRGNVVSNASFIPLAPLRRFLAFKLR